MKSKMGFFSFVLTSAATAGVIFAKKRVDVKRKEALEVAEDNRDKFYEFYCVLLRWLQIYQDNKSAVDYFKNNNYKTVAIYGMGELGEKLLRELDDSDIMVKYGIDRSADTVYVPIDVYRSEEELLPVDVVVVTAIHYFNEIEKDLSRKLDCPIVSIEDVLWEI